MTGHEMLRARWDGGKGLSQEKIAEQLNVSQAYVSLLLRGERTVTQRVVAQRAEEVFGIPVASWPVDAPTKRLAAPKRKATGRGGVVRRVSGRRANKSAEGSR